MMWIFYIGSFFVTIYIFLKHKHCFWKRRGIAQIAPEFLYGNIKKAVQEKSSFSELHRTFYKQFKLQKVQHGGIYLFYRPSWVPIDLDLIKQMMTTDFEYFSSHGIYHHDNDWLSNNIFNLEGEHWKTVRSKLTPTFTSGKMKSMYVMLDKLSDRLETKIEEYCKKGQPVEIKEHAACFGVDAIATCFFGLETDCLNYPDNDFRRAGKSIVEPRPIKFVLECFANWNLLGKLGYRFFPQNVTDLFVKIVRESTEFRKNDGTPRNDYLGLLLQLKDNNQFTEQEIAANMLAIYAAGFDTSSSTTSYLLYELAKHQDVQDKVREEIWRIGKRNPNGKFTYDDLADMKYAEMCINETLRMYTPIPEVPRNSVKDYTIPGTNQVISKGILVTIPVWSIHHDPDYYPNPEQFNPDNFLPENKASRHEFSFFPFGGGPRLCIGYRFAMMQVKVNLIKQLRNYRFRLNPKAPEKISFHPITLTLTAKEDLLLDVSPF
ncbi:unnamed protein product [Ceutorhynchus assimilis]|uniref:Cytochrome P450 n=1 Tax=Ceutorhynchus assimilis TaxID=467358 RepID=A0A9N9MT12_9CUCU|nr:unnamed protein product [Ceutorhynchus assimilis]